MDEGTVVLLNCDVTGGAADVQIDWLNSASEIVGSGRAFSLLADVTQHQAGYTCRVGSHTDTITIVVNCEGIEC